MHPFQADIVSLPFEFPLLFEGNRIDCSGEGEILQNSEDFGVRVMLQFLIDQAEWLYAGIPEEHCPECLLPLYIGETFGNEFVVIRDSALPAFLISYGGGRFCGVAQMVRFAHPHPTFMNRPDI